MTLEQILWISGCYRISGVIFHSIVCYQLTFPLTAFTFGLLGFAWSHCTSGAELLTRMYSNLDAGTVSMGSILCQTHDRLLSPRMYLFQPTLINHLSGSY